jgi:hypothetical protein
MAWTVEQLADLVTSTQKDLGELKWVDLSMGLTEYPGWRQVLQKEKVKIESGIGIQWNIQLNAGTQAKAVDLYEEDDYNVEDSLTTATIPWKHLTTNYVIERRETAMNRSPRKLVDLVKVRRNMAMGALIEMIEEIIWSAPTAGSKNPYGIPYWNVKWTTGTTTPGFTGTNPNGFSDVAGKDTTAAAYSRFRNYAGKYTNVAPADLIKKMRTMRRKINFKSPLSAPGYDRGESRYTIDVNETTYAALEDLLDARNDNLGKDLAGMEGTFGRSQIRYIPQLDEDDSNPVYMNNWAVMFPVFLKGEYLNEMTHPSAKVHTAVATDIDLTFNMKCHDRRRLGVLSQKSKTGTAT